MSQTTIYWNFTVGGIPVNPTSAVFSDPTGTFGVRRTDTLAVVVPDGTALTNIAVGQYRYTFTDPAYSLTYNYWIEFVYLGNTFRVEQNISGSTPPPTPTTPSADVVPVGVENYLIDEADSAVKLARYAHELGISEDQFFGINNPSTVQESCHPIWTLRERQSIARYLKEAQDEIELVTGYPLAPRWFTDEFKYYGFPVHAKWTKIIAAGFRNTAMVKSGASVSYATDPSVIVTATALTDANEIKVFHPGTEIEIQPSSISISGGNVTIQIPRARLVKSSAQNNDENGLDYADVPPSASSPFESTVDVVQVYNDDSIQGALTWLHRDSSECTCDCIACCGSCNTYSENACITIRNAESGALDLLSASYANSAWTVVCTTCYCSAPDSVLLNYKAGVLPRDLTQQMVTMIIRLAHSKMPSPPCGCGVAQDYWARDRKEPEIITVERAACSFGLSDGAWFAWRQANAIKYQRGFALG